ncbi:MAG: (2Fe-2S)-binding protein [Anaerolineae bacterium]
MNDDLIICRCQEITQTEIEEAIRQNDLRLMQEVKRTTRAGMGLCQGKTCGHLVTGILTRETKRDRSEVEPDRTRPPVRAVPVRVLANRVTGVEDS